MALVVHPYIMGAPHRLKWFRQVFERMSARKDVLFWTGEQILDWHRAEQERIQREAQQARLPRESKAGPA